MTRHTRRERTTGQRLTVGRAEDFGMDPADDVRDPEVTTHMRGTIPVPCMWGTPRAA